MQNSGEVVLVIEDNEQNMVLFRDLPEARGCNVLQATNGMGAGEAPLNITQT